MRQAARRARRRAVRLIKTAQGTLKVATGTIQLPTAPFVLCNLAAAPRLGTATIVRDPPLEATDLDMELVPANATVEPPPNDIDRRLTAPERTRLTPEWAGEARRRYGMAAARAVQEMPTIRASSPIQTGCPRWPKR